MSYYIEQIKLHAGLHIKQYGHAKFTVKRWKSAVRRNLTTDSYGDWAVSQFVLGLGLDTPTPPQACGAPQAPSLPPAPRY